MRVSVTLRVLRVVAVSVLFATVAFAAGSAKGSGPSDCCGTVEGENCYLDVQSPCTAGPDGDKHCATVNPNFPKCCPAMGICQS